MNGHFSARGIAPENSRSPEIKRPTHHHPLSTRNCVGHWMLAWTCPTGQKLWPVCECPNLLLFYQNKKLIVKSKWPFQHTCISAGIIIPTNMNIGGNIDNQETYCGAYLNELTTSTSVSGRVECKFPKTIFQNFHCLARRNTQVGQNYISAKGNKICKFIWTLEPQN